MPYLICDRCNVYYEIDEMEDEEEYFCECGNKLKYYETLEEYVGGPIRETFGDRTHAEKMAQKYNMVRFTGLFLAVIGLLFLFLPVSILVFILGISMFLHGHRRYRSWKMGAEGEEIVASYLDELPEDYFIFNDVHLPISRGNIDHIVAGPTGIFVIETKNYTGLFEVREDEWIKHGTGRSLLKNPGEQAKENAIALRNFLKSGGINTRDLWIEAIVTLIRKNVIIKKEPKNYKILNPEEIVNFILNNKANIDQDLLIKTTELIMPYTSQFSSTPV